VSRPPNYFAPPKLFDVVIEVFLSEAILSTDGFVDDQENCSGLDEIFGN
jgi:hypothetical protein